MDREQRTEGVVIVRGGVVEIKLRGASVPQRRGNIFSYVVITCIGRFRFTCRGRLAFIAARIRSRACPIASRDSGPHVPEWPRRVRPSAHSAPAPRRS